MNLAIIPARGGSKGLPRKNIRSLAGKPLIAWSIEAARKARHLDAFAVSTEDEEIAEVAKKHGAEVLWRPAHLATGEATTIAVVQHIASERKDVDEFIVLQPTSPLRHDGLIDECILEYRQSGADNLATGFYCKFREFGSHNNERRQDYKGFFYDDGNVYVLSRQLVEQGRWSGDRIQKKVISKEQNFEIDDETDFKILEMLMRDRTTP